MSRLTLARFRVELTPAQELTPNRAFRFAGGDARRAAAAVMLKGVHNSLVSAINGRGLVTPLFAGRVEVDTAVWWGTIWTAPTTRDREPRRQYRQTLDNDGLIAALKSTYDALETAGVLANDRQIVRYGVDQDKDPSESGFMVITIRALDGIDVPPCPACGRRREPARAGDRLIGTWCGHCRQLSPAESRIS